MRKVTWTLVLTGILLVGMMGISYGVTNGVADAGRHPYVGLVVFDDADGPAWRCSGSLLSPTKVLVAGHCTDGAVAARVWFDEIVQGNPEYPFGGTTSYEGTPLTNPDYCPSCAGGLPGFAYRDVGIVILTEPVPESVIGTYALLPAAGVVDTLANKSGLDLVGYGVQVQVTGVGLPPSARWTGLRVRLFAPSELVSGKFKHSEEFIKVALNASQGTGGTCFGDSGGPILLPNTRTVLAVNSYVTNYNCSGVGYSSRVDIPAVITWINSQ
jgi:hypothetical protein